MNSLENIPIESNIVFLRCADIKKTTEFYCTQLGLRVWNDQGLCCIFKCGSGLIGFLQDSEVAITNGVCISFNVPDMIAVDNAYEKMRRMGYADKPPCKHTTFDVYSFFITDPDGYTVEFQKILM